MRKLENKNKHCDLKKWFTFKRTKLLSIRELEVQSGVGSNVFKSFLLNTRTLSDDNAKKIKQTLNEQFNAGLDLDNS